MRGWFKLNQAAEYCGLSERKMRSLLWDGLKHSRLKTGTILIKKQWLDEYFEQFQVEEGQVDNIADEVIGQYTSSSPSKTRGRW